MVYLLESEKEIQPSVSAATPSPCAVKQQRLPSPSRALREPRWHRVLQEVREPEAVSLVASQASTCLRGLDTAPLDMDSTVDLALAGPESSVRSASAGFEGIAALAVEPGRVGFPGVEGVVFSRCRIQ